MLYAIKRKLDTDVRHGKAWLYAVKPIQKIKKPYCWVDSTQFPFRHPVAFKSEVEAERKKDKIFEKSYRYVIEPLNDRLSDIADVETTGSVALSAPRTQMSHSTPARKASTQ